MTKAIHLKLRDHWTSKKGVMVPKVQFKTLEDALEFIDKRHINKDVFHPYICQDCGM